MQIQIRQAAGGPWVHTLAALDGEWSVSPAAVKPHTDGVPRQRAGGSHCQPNSAKIPFW